MPVPTSTPMGALGLAALLVSACGAEGAASKGADATRSSDAGTPDDGASSQDGAPPDAARDPAPPPVALAGGGFELVRQGRVLLAADAPPLAAVDYQETTRLHFGLFDFLRQDVNVRRATGEATVRREGEVSIIEWRTGEVRATLSVRDASASVVELRARVEPPGAGLRLDFRCEPEAHFLGFGEQYNHLDHRGRAFPLFVSEQGIGRDTRRPTAFSGDHTTTYFPVPFFLDPRGFGLALDTAARVEVDLCAAAPDVFTLTAGAGGELLIWLYAGPKPPDVLRDFTLRQGRSMAPPAWAVEGVWLGVQGGPDRVRAEVAAAREADVPLGAVWVQDWVGRREFGLGNTGVRYRWSADESLYPDLPGLIAELHGEGVRFLSYFNPFLLPDQDLWEPAVADGHAVLDPTGSPYLFLISVFQGGLVDLSNPAAVEWYRGFARAALDSGHDGWMQDFGEWLPVDASLHQGDAQLAHNLYPTAWHEAARGVMDEKRPDGDFVLLSRSGWLGEAHTAQVVWAGDQEATWAPDDGLPTVIPAMISLGLAGIGFVTHDIAGFSGGPSDAEIFQRWTELGAFTPIMRTHEGLQKDRNWRWNTDAATRDHFSRFARVHRALAPMFQELGRVHRETGLPIVRGLSLMFPDDPMTFNLLDEYLLGDELLVAPVITQGATSRQVYFPAGRWHDVWEPEVVFEGPRTLEVPAPLGRPPVFSRQPRRDLAALLAR